MKKLLLLLTTLASLSLSASAADKFYSFTFRDTSGQPFCDGLSLRLIGSGGAKNLVDGVHFGCVSSNVVGVKAGVLPALQYQGIGAALVISDFETFFSPDATMWLINVPARTWVLYQNAGSGVFLNSFGTWINGANATSKNAKAAGSR